MSNVEVWQTAARRLAAPVLDKGFRPEALHTYTTADGTPLFWRIRAKHPETGEKWIRPMHLIGGRYQFGEPKFEGPKPLYNLTRLARATHDVAIVIVEGEKAVDALTRIDVLATTSGAADSADRADWSICRGRKCIIWPDRDEAGIRYGEAVEAILCAMGCNVEWLDVDQLNLPEKGDAADWCKAHPERTAADVLALPRRNEEHRRAEVISQGEDRVTVVCASDIEPEAIDWLWPGYLARGKVHIIAGAPSTGKTTLTLGMIACVSSGGRFPDLARASIGSALIWSGEDSLADTLVPRLLAAGADLSRVHFVGDRRCGAEVRPFDPATDFSALELEATRIRDLRIVMVDPIVSAVAGDGHKGNDVRRALQPLVQFAHRTGCAVIGISHFSKGTAGRDPIERVTGSIAFAALARVVLATAKVPDEDGGGRIMVRAKSNLGPDGGGFRYELQTVELSPPHGGIVATRPEWGAALEGEARQLLAAAETVEDPEERSASGEAAERLREILLETGSVETKEARKRLRAEGFTEKQIRRAREALGIVRRRSGFGGKDYWDLPGSCPVPAVDAQPQKVGANGQERTIEGMNGAAPDDGEVL